MARVPGSVGLLLSPGFGNMPVAGGWRSGSAAPLHGDGRGFESLIAHQPFARNAAGNEDRRGVAQAGGKDIPQNAPNHGSASQPIATKSDAAHGWALKVVSKTEHFQKMCSRRRQSAQIEINGKNDMPRTDVRGYEFI